jgi:hypothetical protein
MQAVTTLQGCCRAPLSLGAADASIKTACLPAHKQRTGGLSFPPVFFNMGPLSSPAGGWLHSERIPQLFFFFLPRMHLLTTRWPQTPRLRLRLLPALFILEFCCLTTLLGLVGYANPNTWRGALLTDGLASGFTTLKTPTPLIWRPMSVPPPLQLSPPPYSLAAKRAIGIKRGEKLTPAKQSNHSHPLPNRRQFPPPGSASGVLHSLGIPTAPSRDHANPPHRHVVRVECGVPDRIREGRRGRVVLE